MPKKQQSDSGDARQAPKKERMAAYIDPDLLGRIRAAPPTRWPSANTNPCPTGSEPPWNKPSATSKTKSTTAIKALLSRASS